MTLTSDLTGLTADSMISVSSSGFGSVFLDDYLSLITSFHRGKPKFTATVAATLDPFVEATNFINGVPAAFDLDTAIGAQLDVVGQWVGRSRFITIPLPNLYFALDDAARGLDKGIWKGPYDADNGITRLDDETYRIILRAKIAANNWDGTLASAQADLATIFAGSPGTNVFLTDNLDMSETFNVSGKIPSVLVLQLLSAGYIPLKPEGVKPYYLITSVNNTPLFGLDVQNQYVSGLDTGSWGVSPDYIAQNPIY